MVTLKRQPSRTSQSDYSTNTLFTFVNGVTGYSDSNIRLKTISSLYYIFEVAEMYDGELSQALKAGDMSEVVVIRTYVKSNSSSLSDDLNLRPQRPHLLRLVNLRTFKLF